MKLFDYTCITTFWDDFSIAEKCGGIPAIRDTYKRAFEEWKTNYKYLTELVVVLNYKILQWYDGEESDMGQHTEIARCYSILWQGTARYAETHLQGEELKYYFRVAD